MRCCQALNASRVLDFTPFLHFVPARPECFQCPPGAPKGKFFVWYFFPAQTLLMKEKLKSFLWKLLSFKWTKIILNKRELCCCRKQTAIAESLAISLTFPSLCPSLSVYKMCFAFFKWIIQSRNNVCKQETLSLLEEMLKL